MIKIKNLYKSYDELNVFNNFNLNIERGEIVAIVGHSGAGKSTLLNIIGGLEKANAGEIYINNELINWNDKKIRLKMFRHTFSYLFQNYGLVDNMTVSENLDIALKYTKNIQNKLDKKIEVLKKVSINEKLNTKVFKLSGGEQQRVAIAKLFLKDSEIILADEPTASVDKENAQAIFNLLKVIRDTDKKTIIIVTHDKYIASLCDRTININE